MREVTKKNGLEGGLSKKKIRERGVHLKYYLYWRGVVGKNLVTGGGVMQLSNDNSKNSTSPPYLVKNERSLDQHIALVSRGTNQPIRKMRIRTVYEI